VANRKKKPAATSGSCSGVCRAIEEATHQSCKPLLLTCTPRGCKSGAIAQLIANISHDSGLLPNSVGSARFGLCIPEFQGWAGYNRLVIYAAGGEAAIAPAPTAGKALTGFLLSGFLFALLGALLPAWGYHRDPPEFITIGNCFLSLGVGVIAAHQVAAAILARKSVRFLLVFACGVGCAGLLSLAFASPPVDWAWRAPGLAALGLAVGLLNAGLFQTIAATYSREPARAVAVGGIYYGLGCLAATLLVAGTFYVYTVPGILMLMALAPGLFAGLYARIPMAAGGAVPQADFRQVYRDFRSLRAVLFALLLFFQFGNEWSIAGWLPLFLVRRLGMSPPASLWLLSLYWTALLVGRVAAVAIMPRVRHSRLLGGSVLAALFGCLLLAMTNNQFGAGTGLLLLGAGFASIYPLVAEKIGSFFPYYNPVFFSGIFSFALFGGLIAPATLGYAASIWGIGIVVALPLLGICMVSVLLLLIWLESMVTGH
jgi:MFS transporter, FHS family, glucose/mannose:H+ symporter